MSVQSKILVVTSFMDANGVHVHCNTIHLDGFSRPSFCWWDPPGRSSWGRSLICSVDRLDVKSTQF